MKNFRLQRNIHLIKINEYLKQRIGDSARAVLGIMALLLVFCGLVVGLLGRGWAGAWFLVFLGIAFGAAPCLAYLMGSGEEAAPDNDEQRTLLSDEVPDAPGSRKRSAAAGATDEHSAELDRQAKEFEELLERQRLKKELEEERRRQAAEQERREREAAAAREAERLEQEKRKKEERRRADEEKRERRRRFEEERRREQDRRRKNNTYGNVVKAPGTGSGGSYFSGVSGRDELKKRYKELIKKYHPDNGAGDMQAFQSVQREYEELTLFFDKYERHNF